MKEKILHVQDLYKHFPYRYSLIDRLAKRTRKIVRAVDGVSFSMQKGEILSLVGESGSGKTTVGMNILGLQIPTKGKILFEEHDVGEWASGTLQNTAMKDEGELENLSKRGQILALRRRSQMIFQDPYESLNPRQKVFDIISEPLVIHQIVDSKDEKTERVRAALDDSGLAPADHFWDRYPEELSGGQRQRVVIAGALVLEPDLLVADEPVSMLDVSIRAEILHLLRSLRLKRDITILYTTHDLATAGYFTDRMAVMYLGRIVELGPTKEVLSTPLHPYTQALISVIPAPNPRRRQTQVILEGEVPNPIDIPSGCRFHPRCPIAIDECRVVDPPEVEMGKNGSSHKVSCLRVE